MVSDDDVTAATYTYSFASGNAAGKFRFDASTPSMIETAALIEPDVATGDATSYTLVVEVSDGGTPALTGSTTVIITVTTTNDHDPVFGASTPSGVVMVSLCLHLFFGVVVYVFRHVLCNC